MPPYKDSSLKGQPLCQMLPLCHELMQARKLEPPAHMFIRNTKSSAAQHV